MKAHTEIDLIGAAPYLLEALKAHITAHACGSDADKVRALDLAMAAIAMAEGQEEREEPCVICGAPVRAGHPEDHDEGCASGRKVTA